MRGLPATIFWPMRATRSETSFVAAGGCLNAAAWVRGDFPNGLVGTVVSFLSSERQPTTAKIKPNSSSAVRAFMILLPGWIHRSLTVAAPRGGEGNDRELICLDLLAEPRP